MIEKSIDTKYLSINTIKSVLVCEFSKDIIIEVITSGARVKYTYTDGDIDNHICEIAYSSTCGNYDYHEYFDIRFVDFSSSRIKRNGACHFYDEYVDKYD